MKSVTHLLFKRKFPRQDGSNRPLYRFQSELARDIVSVSNDYDNADSLRPYLNQTLKYDGKLGKPMSQELQEAIVMASSLRINETSPLKNEFRSLFNLAYQASFSKKKSSSFDTDDLEFEFLSKWQKKANRTFVFNREPIEVKYLYDDIDAGELIDSLFENLLLNFSNAQNKIIDLDFLCHAILEGKKIRYSDTLKGGYRFIYFVSSFNMAKNLWDGLSKYLNDKITDNNIAKPHEVPIIVKKALSLLNGTSTDLLIKDNKPKSMLRVYKTEGYLLTIPVVYYECESGISHPISNEIHFEKLFSLMIEKDNKKSVSMIEGKDLDFWKEEVFFPLFWSSKCPFPVEEISFELATRHIYNHFEI